MALLVSLLASQSGEERAMTLSLAHEDDGEEILAFTSQLASECVDLDDEAARVARRTAALIVNPMVESPAEHWRALGCRIGTRFLEHDIGWELDLGQVVVMAVASCHLKANPPEPLRALELLQPVDTPAMNVEPRLGVKRLIVFAHRLRGATGRDDLIDVLGQMVELGDSAEVRVELSRELLGRGADEDRERAVVELREALRLADDAELKASAQALLAMLLDASVAYREAWSRSDLLPPKERLRLASKYARHLWGGGRPAEALRLGETALKLADEESDALNGVAHALLLRECARALGDDTAAERYGRIAVERWESVRQDPQARDQSLATMHDQLAFLHRKLAQKSIDTGDLAGAFGMALRMRGRTLGELLAVRASPPSRRVPAALWHEAITAWKALDDASDLDEAEARFDACIERVRAHDPLAGRILELRSPTVEEVVGNLQPGCALVMFVPLPDGLHAFIAAPALTVVKVSDADLGDVAEAVLDWVVEYDEFRFGGPQHPERMADVQRHLNTQLERLAALVRLDRLYPYLRGIERLQIVAHHPLSLLPLHVLPGRRLIDRFDVSYLPAAIFAGLPSVDAIDVEDVAGAVVDSLRGTPRTLLYATLEEAAVRRCFRAVDALEGADATRFAVLELAGRSAHLHLACHAEQSFKSLGKLLLADGDSVEAGELGRTGAPTGVVVLSGCETGLASALTLGEEYLAFPATLIAYGAGAVVGTMWQVEDRAAVLVASRFYESLRRGRSPARSLRLAQTWLRRADGPALARACDAITAHATPSVATRMLGLWADRQRGHAGVRRYEHPFYWAPFFLTGTMSSPPSRGDHDASATVPAGGRHR